MACRCFYHSLLLLQMVNDGSSLTEIGKFAIHVYSQSMFMDVAGFRKLFRLL